VSGPFTPEQNEVLIRLVTAWADRKMVLIGAAALGCHVTMTWRRTNDLDLTVVAGIASTAAELQELGFRRDDRYEHRWFSSSGVALDILPVTRDDVARGKLIWPESGFVMGLQSFDLLFTHTQRFSLDESHELEIATLPVIVLLKMTSWLDKPYERQRDLQDIGFIMSEYLADDADRRWNDSRLEGVEFDEQGAPALGLDLAAIAASHHREIAHRFLDQFTDSGTHAFQLLGSAGRSGGRGRDVALAERLVAVRGGFGATRGP